MKAIVTSRRPKRFWNDALFRELINREAVFQALVSEFGRPMP